MVHYFFIPSVNIIGSGAGAEIPVQLKLLGAKKPLLVTDKGITAIGLTKQVVDSIKAAGLDVAVFDEAIPNPTDTNVHDGAEAYKKNGCDSLLSLGGGSSHDCCKGVGFVVANGGKIHDYEGVNKSTQKMPPFVAVNTTAGTASEMTRFCIITNTSNHVKMALVDWRCTASVSINDAQMMVGKPPALTAATGMDALTHAVEAYVSTIAEPITDACAEKCIEIIGKYLRKAVALGTDIDARENMAFAQFLGGMAFNNASLGYVHAMAHQLGGFYDLPHGVCNAILLPHVCEFNLIARVERFAKIGCLLGAKACGLSERDAADVGIAAIRKLSADIGIPANLTDAGKLYGKNVQEKDIPTMTANAQKDACMLTNPRQATDAQVAAIFKAAL